MLNDLFVLAKIKEGDVKAFEEVFRLYYSPLCLYAASMTGQMEVAEEIVEELFYVFWKDKEKLHVFRSIKSYLYGAVRNQSLQYLEHMEVMKRHQETVLSSPLHASAADPQELIEYKELQVLIHKTLEQLPPVRRRIFCMHRMEGKKYAAIASLLGLSVKTVEAEISKALRVLRKEIENYIQTT